MGKDSFKYALVLDKLKAEQESGITVDMSPLKFETQRYSAAVVEVLEPSDFVKNMIAGTSQIDCAVLIVSAVSDEFNEGFIKQSLVRGFLLLAYTFGVRQIIVGVNKMDATEPSYSQKRFEEIQKEIGQCLEQLGHNLESIPIVPISALCGDNLYEPSDNMLWYKGWNIYKDGFNMHGKTLLETFDAMDVVVDPIDYGDLTLNQFLNILQDNAIQSIVSIYLSFIYQLIFKLIFSQKHSFAACERKEKKLLKELGLHWFEKS